jgi:hypothetical protein
LLSTEKIVDRITERACALEKFDMARVNPNASQKDRLLKANAFRCCVCKRRSIGFHFHHIDENSSNTVDENLAVLCVEDHDRLHRMREYESRARHLELDAKEILRRKNSWEAFVIEANRTEPRVVAILSIYGTKELIHSLQLVMQWPDQRIEHQRSFHLLDGDLDRLTDEMFQELAGIGPNVKLAVINEPLPVEHCPSCRTAFSHTLKPPIVTRLTDPAWATESACGIYINPDRPSLAFALTFREEQILSASLHLCQRKFLDYSSEGVDERIPIKSKPSIRAQAIRIVRQVLRNWTPSNVFIATGDPDEPEIINTLALPKCWEVKSQARRRVEPQ